MPENPVLNNAENRLGRIQEKAAAASENLGGDIDALKTNKALLDEDYNEAFANKKYDKAANLLDKKN